jgi:hypothetical protein
VSDADIRESVEQSVAQGSDEFSSDDVDVEVSDESAEIETTSTQEISADSVESQLRQTLAQESREVDARDVEVEQTTDGLQATAETDNSELSSSVSIDDISSSVDDEFDGSSVTFDGDAFVVTGQERQEVAVDELVESDGAGLEPSDAGDGFDVVGPNSSEPATDNTGTDEFDNIDVEEQRERARAEAAREFDVDEQDVSVTSERVENPDGPDSVEFTAEQEVTDSQRFADGLTGGRVSGVVSAAQTYRENVSETVSQPFNTAADVVTAPGQAATEVVTDRVEVPDRATDAVDTAVEFGSDVVDNPAVNTAGQVATAPGQIAADAVDPARDFAESVDESVDVDARDAGQALSEPLGTAGEIATAPAQIAADEVDSDDIDDVGPREAAAAGAAGVVAPEPVSTTVGAGVAVGAGAVIAADEINERIESNEIEAPDSREPVAGNEVEAPDDRIPATTTQIETPDSREPVTTTELDVPADRQPATTTQIDVPDSREPTTTTEVDIPEISATGIVENPIERQEESQETIILDEDSFIDDDSRSVPSENERLNRIRENLEQRQERNRNSADELIRNPDAFNFVGDGTAETTQVEQQQEFTEDVDVGTGVQSGTDVGLTPIGREDTDTGVDTTQIEQQQLQTQQLNISTQISQNIPALSNPPVVESSPVNATVNENINANTNAPGFGNPAVTQQRLRQRPRVEPPDLDFDSDSDELRPPEFATDASTFEFDVEVPDFLR